MMRSVKYNSILLLESWASGFVCVYVQCCSKVYTPLAESGKM